jgi:transglutaminase-like putative cysteine protease
MMPALPAMPNASGTIMHASGAYSTYRLQPIAADPDTQVAQTIAVMRQYAVEDAASPAITQAARDAVVEAGGGDPVAAVWGYVRARMRFVQDAVTGAGMQDALPDDLVEVLIRPRDMHTWNVGDCDDFVTYGAALLIALGVPVAFATVAADSDAPGMYSHVYLIAYPAGGVRTPLDLSHGQYVGWETPHAYRLREWPVTGGQMRDVLADLLPAVGVAYGAWLLLRGGGGGGSRRAA